MFTLPLNVMLGRLFYRQVSVSHNTHSTMTASLVRELSVIL